MSKLPKGWTSSRLETLVDILDSIRVPLNSTEREKRIAGKNNAELYPYYGATGQVGYIDDYLFEEPSILLGEDGVPFLDPMRPKAYRVSGRYWVNNHAHVIRARSGIADERYISAFLNSFDYTGYVSGSTRLKLTQAAMRSIPVLLAPLNEQQRIADKLDALLARVDTCRKHIDHILPILKRFRQSVLAAATSGELTEDWPDASGDDQKNKWKEVRIGDLLIEKPRNGYSPKAVVFKTDTRSLTLTATTSGRFKPEHFKYIDEKIPESSHLWLEPGDILIQRANTREYVGISAVYDGPSHGFIYPDLMMKCRANEKVNTRFLHYLLLSQGVREYFRENASGTAGNMPKINQQTVINAPIRVAPMEEQREIVRRVETLFTFASNLEARYKAAHCQVERLTHAILAKAFRGELVPQDPDDEPARAILERTHAERATGPAESKRVLKGRKPMMATKLTKESLKETIRLLPKESFSFDELKDFVPGDYESLKSILFELLDETEPRLEQVFDKEAKAIRLVRVR